MYPAPYRRGRRQVLTRSFADNIGFNLSRPFALVDAIAGLIEQGEYERCDIRVILHRTEHGVEFANSRIVVCLVDAVGMILAVKSFPLFENRVVHGISPFLRSCNPKINKSNVCRVGNVIHLNEHPLRVIRHGADPFHRVCVRQLHKRSRPYKHAIRCEETHAERWLNVSGDKPVPGKQQPFSCSHENAPLNL